MGYYCASSKMTYYPYENLLCRISGNDNILLGESAANSITTGERNIIVGKIYRSFIVYAINL